MHDLRRTARSRTLRAITTAQLNLQLNCGGAYFSEALRQQREAP
jgi:hypothetical protein